MKHFISIPVCILLLLLHTSNASAQKQLTKIKSMLLNADSILLTSHIAPSAIIMENEDPNDRKLVINDSINTKFIKERKLIDKTTILQLASLITKPFRDDVIYEGRCFIPHHTIYVFKNRLISYIDICFHCQEIMCSEDIIFPQEDFDQLTWKNLEKFFLRQGFKYGFSDDDD
jgi:hypothetical protein